MLFLLIVRLEHFAIDYWEIFKTASHDASEALRRHGWVIVWNWKEELQLSIWWWWWWQCCVVC